MKRVYLYDMPHIHNKELVQIMLEEILPECTIEGLVETPQGVEQKSDGAGYMSHRIEALIADKILHFKDNKS